MKKSYYYDMHIHTARYSSCSDLDPHDMIDRAIELGIDGVLLTEHHRIWPEHELEKLRTYAAKRGELVILSGMEVTTDVYSDFLVYGAKSELEYGIDLQTLVKLLKSRDIPIIGAHPLRRGMGFSHRNLERIPFTALEVYNSSTKKEAEWLLDLCQTRNIATIGGGDAHSVSEVGRAVTEFSEKIESVAQLVEKLHSKHYHAVNNLK